MSKEDLPIPMRVGEDHEVRLPGLATAGYRWFVEVEGSPAVVAVAEELGSPREDRDPSLVGTSVDEVFRITGLRPGNATLRFAQRRPWEKETPPVDTREVRIEVVNERGP